ncbi:MAG: YggS family pyridoxal phosphate-dependent enzyme [Bacteroidales bacterium]|nr:YggS family pyridoxal phosphate-dependent enzyme [Bacteroidales bacterium]
MSIKTEIRQLKASLPDSVTLVAVSKFHPAENIKEAYEAGQRIFGESRVQELRAKEEILPKDIEWHFIGTLQRNKVKYIVPFISMIHSIDNAKLLSEVNQEAAKQNRIVDVLLQFHIASEETKHGLTIEECTDILNNDGIRFLTNVRIRGVMGMATFTNDEAVVRKEFQTLKGYFDTLKNNYFKEISSFNEISMGMSDDYPIAIEEGSTMIRVGSKIFGARTI